MLAMCQAPGSVADRHRVTVIFTTMQYHFYLDPTFRQENRSLVTFQGLYQIYNIILTLYKNLL